MSYYMDRVYGIDSVLNFLLDFINLHIFTQFV